jgi:hypothetical protein
MARCALALALLVACGTTRDDRPRTIQYVTEAILAPTCGAAECHSTFSQAKGDVFDTVTAARRSLVRNGLIDLDSSVNDPADPDNAQLIVWITHTDPYGLGIGRMPLDAPMPNADVNLLKEYIRESAPGAQCDPDATGGRACNNHDLHTCTKDWNFGDLVEACPGECASGVCL